MSQDQTIVPDDQPGVPTTGVLIMGLMGRPGVGKTAAISYFQKLGWLNHLWSPTIEETRRIPDPTNTPDSDSQE